MTPQAARTARERGSATLEFSIIAPGVLVLLALLLQVLWWYMAQQAAHAAAAEGARAARVYNAPADAGAEAALRFVRQAAADDLRNPRAQVGGSPTTVQVTVSGQARSFVPGFDLSISRTVHAPRERFSVPGESPGAR